MIRIHYYILNGRKKQKVIKARGVYVTLDKFRMHRYIIAKIYKVKPKDIYIISGVLNKKQLDCITSNNLVN